MRRYQNCEKNTSIPHKELLENVNRLIEISLKLTNKALTLEERLDKWVKLAFNGSKGTPKNTI